MEISDDRSSSLYKPWPIRQIGPDFFDQSAIHYDAIVTAINILYTQRVVGGPT